MKLYYSPGACSLAPHIVARAAGIDLALERVDTKTKTTETGRDFTAINPKGYVPALELDDGTLLTEGPVISQYFADQKPGSGLVPAAGTMERYRLGELLGYINSEIHKTYSPLFRPTTPEETRKERLEQLGKRYALIEERLSKTPFLTGDQFTIADAYLFVVTNWAPAVKLDLSGFPNLLAFQARVAERPEVIAARAAENGEKVSKN
jgi:glutathione S-transferase